MYNSPLLFPQVRVSPWEELRVKVQQLDCKSQLSGLLASTVEGNPSPQFLNEEPGSLFLSHLLLNPSPGAPG